MEDALAGIETIKHDHGVRPKRIFAYRKVLMKFLEDATADPFSTGPKHATNEAAR
jgi:hypothetical protein